MQPEAIWCECAMQVKRNAASRLGQAIGQLARVSIHMSESEGHHTPRRHGRRHRKKRRTEDAASGDDVSSQASASSATQQRLKACLRGILCRLTFKMFKASSQCQAEEVPLSVLPPGGPSEWYVMHQPVSSY